MKKLNWYEKLERNSYRKDHKAKTILSRLTLIFMIMFMLMGIFLLGFWLISKLP
jgi:hypothetical protein